MNSCVEGGRNESSEVGRGRGRTRWIVTGGEGSLVA